MRALFAILRIGLRSMRTPPQGPGRRGLSGDAMPRPSREPGCTPVFVGLGRLALAVALASLAGSLAGLLPAVVGAAIAAVSGRAAPPQGGVGGLAVRLFSPASAPAVVLAALAATLVSALAAIVSSRAGTELAGELTAALRIELFRAAIAASPRDVEAAGRAIVAAHTAKVPPPSGAAPPPARGADVVKLAIARDAGVVADFAVAFVTGLPQSVAALAVLAADLAASGMGLVLVGGVGLFVLSRLAADRASARVARAMREMQNADTAVFGALGEALAGAEDLRLLGAKDQAVRELATAARRVADARRRFGQAFAVSGQLKGAFIALAPLVIVVSIALSHGDAGAGDVGKLLLVVPLLMARLEALDGLRAGFLERAPVLDATLGLLRLPEHPPRPRGDGLAATLMDDDRRPAAIAFEHVSFTPKGASRPLLDDVSLVIPPGAVVGICGRSGSGKSTLLRLLLRLDEPSSGVITVDGVPLARIAPEQLPRLFGVLGQSTRLFERTVRENLALGLDPPPPDERMREALRRVELDALASEPSGGAASARGLGVEVRTAPPSLSGGEARRLLLARMLMREPRVFVLDEPEAGLPGATAEAVLRTAFEVAAGRTTLVVTHAPDILRSTFNVLIESGRIAAVGTHDELASRSELYRSLLAEARERPTGPVSGPKPR